MSVSLIIAATGYKHARNDDFQLRIANSQNLYKKRKVDRGHSNVASSRFERLPLELLEQIYVESNNVQLSNVSRYLRDRLCSDHVRRSLISHVLRSENLVEEESLFVDQFRTDKQTHRFHDRESYYTALRDLRLVFSQQWFTFKLLKEAMVEWQWNVASHELKDFLAQYRPESARREYPAASKLLRECLEKSTVDMTATEIAYFENMKPRIRDLEPWLTPEVGRPWKFLWPVEEDAPTRIHLAFLENPWEKRTALGCVKVGVCSITPTHRKVLKVSEKHFAEWRCGFDLYPPRWLEDPTTQDRGDLLKFICDRLDEAYFGKQRCFNPVQLEATQLGLTQAILHNNTVAVFMYTSACNLLSDSPYVLSMRKHIFKSDRCEPMEQPKGDQPWTHFSGTQIIHPRNAAPLLQVSASQLHECIDNYHDHRLVSLQIFDHVARYATQRPSLNRKRLQKLQIIASAVRSRVDPFPIHLVDAATALWENSNVLD